MTLKHRSLVQEVSTATFGGVGPVQLAGPPPAEPSRRRFVDTVGDGHSCKYVILDAGGDWEHVRGTVQAGSPDQITRDEVLENSLGTTAKIDFEAGTKDVFIADEAWPDLSGAGDAGTPVGVNAAGTGFALLAAAGLLQPRGFVAGLVPASAADADHDVTISAGAARDDADAANLALASALTKQLDAAWAVGSDAGGLDTGVIDADSWYHLWLIARSDTGVVDALFSLSASAPTMPASYDRKRRIGAVLTGGTLNIVAFSARETEGGGLETLWDVPVTDLNETDPGTAAVLRTLSVPNGIQVEAIFSVLLADQSVAANTNLLVTSPDQADTAPTNPLHDLRILAGGPTDVNENARFGTRTDASARVRTRLDASTPDHTLDIVTHGWHDARRVS